MVFQSNSNRYSAYKVQSALGSQASGAAAKIFRSTGTGGSGALTKAVTASGEVRRDGMRSRGRHGSQGATGSEGGQLAIGAYDDVIEAIMRGTWGSANLAITEADMTSITVTEHAIVAAAGSWITEGLRVGQVIRLTEVADAANMNRNLLVTALTALEITVAETLTPNASPDTDFTVTRPGCVLINPAAGALQKRYFTWEDHEVDIDASEVFTDCVFQSGKFTMQPDGILLFDANWTGTGRFESVEDSASPHFTSPAENSAVPLAVIEAAVRLGDEDVADCSAFDLTFDIGANAPKTFGVPGTRYSPDVFTGLMGITMNITMLRQDHEQVARHLSEEVLSLHVLAAEPDAAPEDFFSIHVPNFTLGGVQKSAKSMEAGGMTQTLSIPLELVGKDERGGAYDPTMISFQRSNAS